ncbi:L,D-transpeptidase [Aestuariivirga sp.]|uniref:L,D-transpeptidase n=1 Tax=Aestuariivirga sp. TaxID=2650926 RepID=UPI003593AB27
MFPNTIQRRRFLGATALVALAPASWFAAHVPGIADTVEDISQLKPGQFTWHPDRSPAGPVAIIVSLPDQMVHVYRNGIRIAVSTCSTGKPGHGTPTGVFTILQKDKNHHSSTYNNAPMPNMNRLTWSGVALHAGQLPGYPASHGCVRLPLEFSKLLFTVTHVGTPVIIADAHSAPKLVSHPGLVLGQYAEHEFDDATAKLKAKPVAHPDDANAAAVSVIVSGADKTIEIIENGDTVAKGPATISEPDKPLGSHVFILSHPDNGAKGLAWHAIGHAAGDGSASEPDQSVITRIRAEPDVVEAMKQRMHAGLVLVTTDLPSTPDSRTGKDFVILNQGDA